ncbi:MAG: RICIN domain-containing protein [Actinoplanes sp.]
MTEHVSPRGRPLQSDDPRQIGRYEVLGRLGAGGMGVVYLARAASGRLVAVKLVHAELARDTEFRHRFSGEVDRARQVPPFCTAEVLDADPDAAQPYLVVEYVDGPSLAEEVRDHGPLSSANLHAVAIGMATALAAIHEAGVIHRDLKPSNVLLAPGSPKVIDFGIARAMEPSAVQLTRTGQIFGTVNYMAPERFGEPGVPLTPAADIFAWACVVAFAATGRAPFEADSPMATMARILTQPPALNGLADGPLRRLVERALLSDPTQRPTARELLAHLLGSGDGPTAAFDRQPELPTAALGMQAGSSARRSGKASRRSTAVLLGAVVVLALTLAAGTAFVIYRGDGLTKAAALQPAAQRGAPSVFPASSQDRSKPSRPPDRDRSPAGAAPSSNPSATASPSAAAERDNQPVFKADEDEGVDSYGPYFIYNLKTLMCVDLPGTGGGSINQPVVQNACIKTAEDNQEWTFVRHGTGDTGNQLYWIRNLDDGLCLDVPGTGAVTPGTPVTEMDCLDHDNQDFRLKPRITAGGWLYYQLINPVSGLCLDVLGLGDGGAETALTLATCATGDDHEWALIEKTEW